MSESEGSTDLNKLENTTDDNKGIKGQPHKIYFYRYVALFAYGLIYSADQILASYMIPLFFMLGKLYDINLGNFMTYGTYISLLAIPSTFLVIPLIEKKGVHISLLIGTMGVAASAWLRAAININIYFLLVEQVLHGFFGVFYMVAITKVSVRWFPPSQRIYATFCPHIVADMSIFLGSYIPNWYVTQPDEGEAYDIPKLRNDIYEGLFMEAILASSMFTVALLLYRERPKTPPSPADDAISNKKKSEILKGMLKLLRNKNCMLLILGHAIYWNMLQALLGIKTILVEPFGINPEKTASYSLMVGVVTGFVSSVSAGIFISKYKKYKLAICISVFLTSGVCAMNTFLPYLKSIPWIMAGTGISSFVSNPELSIVYEFACELGYPVGESAIIAFTKACSIPLAIITQEAMKDMVNHPSIAKSIAFGLATAGVYFTYGFIVLVFVKQELRRDRRDTSIMEGLPFEAEYFHSVAEAAGIEESEFQMTPMSPLLVNTESASIQSTGP